jgi:integrase
VPTTVQRTLARFRAVFDHADGMGWRDGRNPAELGPIKRALGQRPAPEEKHHPAMPWAKLPAFYAKLAAVEGPDKATADALRFTILTAARTQESRDVPWKEIDTRAKIWTCPGPRMKRRRPHRFPLSEAALAVLASRPEGKGADLVFAGVSRSAMYELLATMGLQTGEASVHGFRSSFTDWCVDTKACDSQLADIAIAHRIKGKTQRAYLRSDRLEERRPVMDQWAWFLTGDPRQFG